MGPAVLGSHARQGDKEVFIAQWLVTSCTDNASTFSRSSLLVHSHAGRVVDVSLDLVSGNAIATVRTAVVTGVIRRMSATLSMPMTITIIERTAEVAWKAIPVVLRDGRGGGLRDTNIPNDEGDLS